MSLVRTFEKSGTILFRYRGQIPMLLFLPAIPVIYYTDYSRFHFDFIISVKVFSIILCAVGLGVRVYTIGTAAPFTSGRNREEQVAESLNTTGIYSVVRHPLYLGNYLMWAGIIMYTMNLSFFIIVSLLFWIYYERIMFTEERFLERKFGEAFSNWAAKTPAFLPAFSQFRPSRNRFSAFNILKEYSGILAAVVSFVFIQTLQDYFTYGEWVINYVSISILLVTLLMVVVIKYFIRPMLRKK
jgi:protein-S-isoprenylcysteine O-methyltransferase Ste14